jgi:WD40 repeat protein
MLPMNTFEITLQRQSGNTWPIVVEQSAAGVFLPVRYEGVLQVDLEEFKAQLRTSLTSAREYGTLLGQALFRDEIRDAFLQALAKSEDRLHVLLFVEDADLKVLRWERLCAPLAGRWDLLALNQRVPFSLYLPSTTDRPFPPIGRRDLRALVLVANPDGLDGYELAPFDAVATIAGIRAALGEIPSDVLAIGEGAVGPPTLDTLCTRITEGRYTLLHVVGHGKFMPGNGEPLLFLAGADNSVDPVTGTRLLDRLRQLRGARGLPHFAFLSTCESALAEEGNALGGLGQRLVRDLGMPAVLAMTEKVSIATAQALAEQYYRRLREHGELDRALVESCAGLAERPDVTVPVLYSRLGGRPLFSLGTDDELKDSEIAHGLSRMEGLLPGRAPVLLKQFQDLATALRGLLGTDRAEVSPTARDEWEQALAVVNNLCTEALDLSFRGVADDQQPPPFDARCPFRGLGPFKAEDRPFFFGREAWTAKLKKRLSRHNFLAVLGPSGSGKSSVVLAGVIPTLQDEEPGLELIYLTPGQDPLASLESRLAAGEGRPAVLVVDQFEELFSLCTDKEVRKAFLDRLLGLAERMRVVITMRADFWGECAPYPSLRDRMLDHQVLIPPMGLEELRQSMKKQAEAVRLQFETGLISMILDHVEGQPGAMPLLQHALLELWNRRHGRWLKGEEYQAIGRVQGAIAKTADTVYDALPDDSERQHMRDVFLRLTQLEGSSVQGAVHRDTRKRVQMDELRPAGVDPRRTMVLLKSLADARLIVTSTNPVTGREEVEVAHEALISGWPRLRDWLDEDRAGLQLRQTIGQAALEWDAQNREEHLLVHRGSRLEEAVALTRQAKFAFNQLELVYLDACVAIKERERREAQARLAAEERARHEAEKRAEDQTKAARRLFRAALALLGMFVLAGVAAGLAWWQWSRAEGERLTAESRELAANAMAQLPLDPQLSLLLARKAVERSQTAEAEDALRAALLDPTRAVLREHRGSVNSAAFSPDGKWIVTTSDDHKARLWGANNGHLRAVLTGHSGKVTAAEFSPDGKFIVTACEDATARVWKVPPVQSEVQSVEDCVVLNGTIGKLSSASFSRAGEFVVTVGKEKASLWDARTGTIEPPFVDEREKQEYRGHVRRFEKPLYCDGRFFVETDGENTTGSQGVYVWEVQTSRCLVKLHTTTGITSAMVSGDGQLLATANGDNTARVLDMSTGCSLAVMRGHEAPVQKAVFSPDGRFVVTTSDDSTARVWKVPVPTSNNRFSWWSVQLGGVFASSSGPLHYLPYLQVKPVNVANGQLVPNSAAYGGVSLEGALPPRLMIREQSLKETAILLGHTQPVIGAAFSPHDGRLLLTWSKDATVRVWETSTGKAVAVLAGHAGTVHSANISPNGKLVVTASQDNTARVWDVTTGESSGKPLTHTKPLQGAAFGPGAEVVVTRSDDGTARVWNATTGESLAVLPGHNAAFSPNAKFVLLAGSDNKAWIWETATRRRLHELRLHTGRVTCVAFSFDGKLVVTGSVDGTARLWSAATGESITELKGPGRPLNRVAFSPDDRYVATESGEGGKWVWVWDAKTWQSVAELEGDRAEFSSTGDRIITIRGDAALLWKASTGEPLAQPLRGRAEMGSAAFSPDGKSVVTADMYDATVWDVPTEKTKEPTGRKMMKPRRPVLKAAFSHDGRFIIAVCRGVGGEIAQVWEADTGDSLAVMRGHKGMVNLAAFSPDDKLVITAGEDNTPRIWDVRAMNRGEQILPRSEELRGHERPVRTAAFSLDGRFVLTASQDNTARLWTTGTGEPVAILRGQRAVFSPDGRFIATASGDDTAWLATATSPPKLTELPGHSGEITTTAFSPDGKRAVTASDDGTGWVWDTANGKNLAVLRGHTGPVSSAAFNSNGKRLITGGDDPMVRIWDAAGGVTTVVLPGHTSRVERVAFSPDDKYVVTTTGDALRMWEASTCDIVATLTGHSPAFSLDGRLMATAGADQALVLAVDTRDTLAVLSGHTGTVHCVAFSPDGRFIVTASADKMARVWEVRTGRRVLELLGHTDEVVSAAFSPDGKKVVTASKDNTARVFACEVCGTVHDLKALAGNRITRDFRREEREQFLHSRGGN